MEHRFNKILNFFLLQKQQSKDFIQKDINKCTEAAMDGFI